MMKRYVIKFFKREERYHDKMAALEPQALKQFEKSLMLQTLDSLWKDHLAAMDYLRQGISSFVVRSEES